VQSFFQQLGLSVKVWEPLIVQVGSAYAYEPRGRLIDDSLEEQITNYDHNIDGEAGFKDARVGLTGSQEYVEEWVDKGLCRHVEVVNPAGEVCFEGFVDVVAVNVGTLTYTGGPLLDVVNRCMVTYTPVDYTASPPARGPATETTVADDVDSQLRYGVLESVLQGGEDAPAGAEQSRDTQLADLATPGHSSRVSTAGGSAAALTLTLAGYGRRLERYVYNDATPGSISVSAKIAAALDADPNGLLSAERDRIADNPLLLAAEEYDNKSAWTVIKGLLPVGTAADLRTFFGVYEDRVPWYWSEPTAIRYRHRIADAGQDVNEFAGGTLVRPWDVRPGYWVFMPDFLAGREPPTVRLRDDRRCFLVESVKFTAPYGVELNGQRFGSVPQLMAKKGLGML
jgi:hypothetical protein